MDGAVVQGVMTYEAPTHTGSVHPKLKDQTKLTSYALHYLVHMM